MRQVVDDIHLAGLQGIHLAGFVSDVGRDDRVEIGQRTAPVVIVADELACRAVVRRRRVSPINLIGRVKIIFANLAKIILLHLYVFPREFIMRFHALFQ